MLSARSHEGASPSSAPHILIVKKNHYLVVGTSEEVLLKFATAIMSAIHTDPWWLEVDLWCSFTNLDIGFIELLQQGWLD